MANIEWNSAAVLHSTIELLFTDSQVTLLALVKRLACDCGAALKLA